MAERQSIAFYMRSVLLVCALFCSSPNSLARPLLADSAKAENADATGTAGRPLAPTRADVASAASNELVPDEIRRLISAVEKHYAEGEKHLNAGDMAKARASFDAAVELILSSGYDLEDEPLLRTYFNDLVRKIQSREAAFLSAEADSQPYEPTLIDDVESVKVFPLEIDPKLKDLVDEDVAKTIYDIPVVVNDKVIYFLNYFQEKLRKKFAEGLIRSGRYKEMIARIFQEEGLPLDLMYMGLVESLFNPKAYSRARAKGIWQFIRSTGRIYGLRINRWIDERSNPEKSTRAAAKHIKDLYQIFGDWYLVMASYNAGKGRILMAIERARSTDFWFLAENNYLPRETANHVPAILASIIIAKNPEKYGFPTELESPLKADRIKIPRLTSLKSIARAIDVPVQTLRDLNPDLRLMVVPAGYEINIPNGKGRTLAAALGRIKPLPDRGIRNTLTSVRLKPAIRPAAMKAIKSARTHRTSSRSVSPTKVVHRVRKGDSLYAIANRYNTTVGSVQRWNNLASSRIYPGDKLTIFVSR